MSGHLGFSGEGGGHRVTLSHRSGQWLLDMQQKVTGLAQTYFGSISHLYLSPSPFQYPSLSHLCLCLFTPSLPPFLA